MSELRLDGCRSRPLIAYLKALGVLRIVSLQLDSSVRARWTESTFELRCESSADEIAGFLLNEYTPSPVVSPWNGGSGFHPNDRQQALLALEQSSEPRFEPYSRAIQLSRAALKRMGIVDKPPPGIKPALVRELRRRLPDEALPWLDAAIVVTGEKVSYPPLLGSGGNDGRYDFSNNYAQAIVQCLCSGQQDDSASWLMAALFDCETELQRKLSLGHFSRDSSPTNSPNGEADSLGNPWDLILAVEGTLLLTAGAARRHGAALGGALVAPFTVYSTAAGYGSAVEGESGRAELWLPLWPQWSTFAEIAMLAKESRARVGRGSSRRQARTGLDFARAAGDLGVARGIAAFERYAILERAGRSNLAVPAGRVSVNERSGAHAVQSIDRWLLEVLRLGNGEHASGAVALAARKLERASFRLASRGAPQDACDTLVAIGEMEHTLARSRSTVAGSGIHPLRGAPASPWIEAANDGTAEFAIATAIASLHDRAPRLPALRDYLHGTQNGGSAFDPERRHAVERNSPLGTLAAIQARRHLDASRTRKVEAHESETTTKHKRRSDDEKTRNRLEFEYGTWCDVRFARMLAAGRLDEHRVFRLLQGLVLLDHRAHTVVPTPITELVWMGQAQANNSQERGARMGPRPGWAARLAAGAIEPVLGDARIRLQMAGLPPICTTRDLLWGVRSDTDLGQRLGAALLLRLSPANLRSIAHRLTLSDSSKNNRHDQKEEAA
jgi:CRISPR-associated protein Csx17